MRYKKLQQLSWGTHAIYVPSVNIINGYPLVLERFCVSIVLMLRTLSFNFFIFHSVILIKSQAEWNFLIPRGALITLINIKE